VREKNAEDVEKGQVSEWIPEQCGLDVFLASPYAENHPYLMWGYLAKWITVSFHLEDGDTSPVFGIKTSFVPDLLSALKVTPGWTRLVDNLERMIDHARAQNWFNCPGDFSRL